MSLAKINQETVSILRDAQSTLSCMRKGDSTTEKARNVYWIKGKKLTVESNLKVYNGYGSKGITGTI